jgi:flagellar biosynthesis/type III secretory pathway chaperone
MPDAQPARPASCRAPRDAMLAFIDLLEREQQALAQPHADALEAIAGEKQVLAREFHALGQSKSAAAAFKADPDMRRMVQRAQLLNEANAKLLTLQRNFCDSRLQLLRGVEQSGALYSANGYLGH